MRKKKGAEEEMKKRTKRKRHVMVEVAAEVVEEGRDMRREAEIRGQ